VTVTRIAKNDWRSIAGMVEQALAALVTGIFVKIEPVLFAKVKQAPPRIGDPQLGFAFYLRL
jgi:hypothetical protein